MSYIAYKVKTQVRNIDGSRIAIEIKYYITEGGYTEFIDNATIFRTLRDIPKGYFIIRKKK